MKEALKLALEALESAKELAGKHDSELEYGFQHTITSIKEALAQPDYRAVKTYHEGKPVYVSQPEQEPSITKTGCGILTLHLGWDDLPDGTKFYTTPPQRPWVGLTDEEIEDCMEMSIQKTCRAIEAKLKELNT